MRRQISTRAVVQRGVYPVRWTQVVPQPVHRVLGMIVRDGQVSATRADGRPKVALSTVAEIWAEQANGQTLALSVPITHVPELALGREAFSTDASVSVWLVGQIQASTAEVTSGGLTMSLEAHVRLEVIAPVRLALDAVSLSEEVGDEADSGSSSCSTDSSSDGSDSDSSASDSSDSDSSDWDGSGSDILGDVAVTARLASVAAEPPPAEWLDIPLKPGLRSVSVTRVQGRATTER